MGITSTLWKKRDKGGVWDCQIEHSFNRVTLITDSTDKIIIGIKTLRPAYALFFQ